MDPRVAAEAHRAAKDRRAGQVRFSGAANDRLIQRPVAARFLVALADEDAKQHAVLRHFHGAYSCRGTGRAVAMMFRAVSEAAVWRGPAR